MLDLIADDTSGSGLNLKQLTESMGMSKSSVFSTLQTLKAYGFVSDKGEGASRRYSLGLALIRLGNRASSQITISDVSLPHLRALTSDTRLTARIAILEGNWAVAIARVDSPGEVKINLGLGEKEWPHRSALGKALLLGHDDDHVREVLARNGMPARTSHTLTTAGDYIADLEESRTRGYTVDDEEDADGIMCIAVPVRDTNNEVVAAISVTGLKAAQEMRHPERIAETLKKHAGELSASLAIGY